MCEKLEPDCQDPDLIENTDDELESLAHLLYMDYLETKIEGEE